LATNDHISSNWISRVSGGKGHEFVVGVSGVLSGQASQPHDGVAMDTDEPFGLTDPVAFDQMFQDGDRLFRGQTPVEQRRTLAFREAGLARLTVEQSDPLVFAIAIADREVAGVALTVERAVGILAAEAREIIHGCGSSREVADRRIFGRKPQDKSGLDDLQ
jgi:hypothetical protein